MKKIIPFIQILFMVNIAILAQELEVNLSGKEIIEKHLEVIGGRDNLRNIQDETMVLKNLPNEPKLGMTIIKKAPNKYYQFIYTDSFSQQTIFNGEKGKTIQFGRELFFDDAENARMSDQSNLYLLLDLEKLKISTKRLQDETINEIDCHVVKLSLGNDVEWTLYFDKSNYYMIRQIIPIFNDRGKFTQAIDFAEFRDFEGYIYPTVIKQLMEPQTVNLRVESIEINSGVEEEMFELD